MGTDAKENGKEVFYYEKGEDGRTGCKVCPRLCNIKPGHRGYCRVRENRNGVLYATNYGQCTSYGVDPIEKKPLYHFHPGSFILSLGTVGCNLRCGFCQNWEIAHGDPKTVYLSPDQAVGAALAAREKDTPNVGLAYTYSEPFMWYEYVYDTSRLARSKGLKNVLVTNGYVNEEPLKALLPYIDAMNIDVKGFTDRYYRDTCAGRLDPVIRTVEISAGKCHVEITTLLVPGLNDSPEEIRELARWLGGIDRDIPLHFSRYFPNYKFDLDPTPAATMLMARETAGEYLNYVYIGNAPELDGGKTLCPQCSSVVIDRRGYRTSAAGLDGDSCSGCGGSIKVIL
ncbi:MAG: AmmeMemoRadiSam system radical SAM enzyme [Actinobacteria bacterium]|nr:AmmeMemoRadiSam system radical SAM enzyme [Actinomycetota bacterium]